MDRRKSLKALKSEYQERRRADALDHQQSARQQAIDQARRAALEAANQAVQSGYINDASLDTTLSPPTTDATAPANHPHQQQQPRHSARHFWASLLTLPEWLIEIPSDLGPAWYVMPRPEGQRCLVCASKGRTVVRLRNGSLSESFASSLPGGGPHQQGGEYCMLDCIYHEPNDTYYILDVMCWRGCDLHDCTTEFRLFWLTGKLSELATTPNLQHQPPIGFSTTVDGSQYGGLSIGAAGGRQFVQVQHHPATPEGLSAAYSGPVPFTRDGLYFIHTQSHYFPGQTPLALVWKDSSTSRYFLDTDAAGVPLEEQHVVLSYRGRDDSVCTGDEPPVPLGLMPQQFVRNVKKVLKDGRLLRFKLGSGGVTFHDGQPTGADLHFVGIANQRRGRADTLSKLLFQYLARTQPIHFEMLVQATRHYIDGGGSQQGMGSMGNEAWNGESRACIEANGGGPVDVQMS